MAAFKSCIGGAHRVRGLKPKVLYLHDGREGQQICRLLRTAGALQNKRHQKSAWFASACPFFYISANQSYHVWNARHCFKLYDIFFCALWVSKFTWFQHWEKEILRIMFLLLGKDARLERWRCSWSASSWTLMLWLARQSHEIRDDYVQLQRFQYIKNLSEPFECEYFYF